MADSPALQVFKIVEEQYADFNSQIHQSRTWNALAFAIEEGLTFGIRDLIEIMNQYGSAYFGHDAEELYAIAVEHKNESFCEAFERWADENRNRPVIRIKNKRVHVGMKFWWKETLVECTSIGENSYGTVEIRAVAHKGWVSGPISTGGRRYDKTVLKRFRITVDDIGKAKLYKKGKTDGVVNPGVMADDSEVFRGTREDDEDDRAG